MSEGQRIPYHASKLPVPNAKSVLVLAPHPDDEVFGCGGCAALYAVLGVPVRALVLTDGGLGGITHQEEGLVAVRRNEVLVAAKILGYGSPVFANLPDRSLDASVPYVVDLIVQNMKNLCADVLFAPSLWEIHPDHRAAAQAAIQAIKQLGEGYTLVQYEVGVPLIPNRLIDITPVLQQKIDSMQCFVSQLAVQAYDKHINALNIFRTYTLEASVTAAEGVRVATFKESEEDPFGLDFEGSSHPLVTMVKTKHSWTAWLKRKSNFV